jgi:hypothetical protein
VFLVTMISAPAASADATCMASSTERFAVSSSKPSEACSSVRVLAASSESHPGGRTAPGITTPETADRVRLFDHHNEKEIDMFSRSIQLLLVATFLSFMSSTAVARAATNPPGSCKAGIAAFAVGQAGIYVNYPVPWPAGSKTSVVVQQADTAGYSPTSVCTYFNVLKTTDSNFQIQHKRCDDGTPVPLDGAATIFWISCPVQ